MVKPLGRVVDRRTRTLNGRSTSNPGDPRKPAGERRHVSWSGSRPSCRATSARVPDCDGGACRVSRYLTGSKRSPKAGSVDRRSSLKPSGSALQRAMAQSCIAGEMCPAFIAPFTVCTASMSRSCAASAPAFSEQLAHRFDRDHAGRIATGAGVNRGQDFRGPMRPVQAPAHGQSARHRPRSLPKRAPAWSGPLIRVTRPEPVTIMDGLRVRYSRAVMWDRAVSVHRARAHVPYGPAIHSLSHPAAGTAPFF